MKNRFDRGYCAEPGAKIAASSISISRGANAATTIPNPRHTISTRAAILLLFAALFAIYNSNLRLIPSLDSDATRVLPISILLDHDVYVDRFATGWVNTYWHSSGPGNHTHAIRYKRNHWVSTYPIVTPILIAPLYIPLAWFIHRYNPPIDTVLLIRLVSFMEKVSASIVASLSAVFLFLCLVRLGGTSRDALSLTLIYALASNTWVIGSQALWLHGTTEMLVTFGLWMVLTADDNGSPIALAAAGIALSLATANRPPTIILATLLGIYAVRRHKLRSWIMIAPAAAIAALYFAYNLYFFDTLTGEFTTQSGWTTPIATGLAGLLFSPSRGLFVYTPWTLFSCAAIALAIFSPSSTGIYRCLALAAVGELSIYSKWWCWWGGSTFGPRLLTDILPLLAILLLPLLAGIRKRALLRWAFAATVAFSLSVQLVGAYFDWPVYLDPADFWSWRNSQLVEAVRERHLVLWSPSHSGLVGEFHPQH